MSLTVTLQKQEVFGNKRYHQASIAFDSSYPTGGESLTAANLGLSAIDMLLFEPSYGFNFEYDHTNSKVKVFAPAPPLVFEEVVTVTSNVGTLKYPAAFINYVGVANAPYRIIRAGLTPLTTQVVMSAPVWGEPTTLTFLSTDTVTSCYVSYITQAWKEIFDNLVHATITAGVRVAGHASLAISEVGGVDVVDLGELACAIQNITWSDNGVIKPIKSLYKAEVAATTEGTIDWEDTTTKISFLASDTMDAAADSIYIDYVRRPTSGFINDNWTEEVAYTATADVLAEAAAQTTGPGLNTWLLHATCGGIPGPTTKYIDLVRVGATLGTTATIAKRTQWGYNLAHTWTLRSNHADAANSGKISGVRGIPGEIPNLAQLEVASANDLSGLTAVRCIAIGS